MAFRSGDRVTFALTYGPDTDWLRDVRAAAGCRLRIRGEILTLGAPVDLSGEAGRSQMPAPVRVVLRLSGVDQFVELPVLHAVPVPGRR